MRSQFTHVIDVAPTVLEAAGIPEPIMVNGIMQSPYEGTSMLYSFDDAAAPERHENPVTLKCFAIAASTTRAGAP